MVSAKVSKDLEATMNLRNFLVELKRRDVYHVAVAYAVVAWLLIQAASILLPTFDVPAWVMKAFLVFVALGFIFSVITSWVFDITPEGIKRTAELSPQKDPDVVRQLEAQAQEQFVRGYLFALIHAGLGDKTEAIDYLKREYLNRDNIDTPETRADPILDSLCVNPQSETFADKTSDLTRPALPMLRLNKLLRRTFAQRTPTFLAIEQILGTSLTQNVAARKNPGNGH